MEEEQIAPVRLYATAVRIGDKVSPLEGQRLCFILLTDRKEAKGGVFLIFFTFLYYYLDFMDSAEAVSPKELEQVGEHAGSRHLLQALDLRLQGPG